MSENGTTKAFRYEALVNDDGIRLLEIQPLASSLVPGSDIKCSLTYTTLSSCENDIIDHYTALSYVWGDTKDTRTIWVDDSPVQVTANLYSAIYDQRDEARVLRLWVDAQCINQQDGEEKSRQVMMMGRIYALAHHTVIYLGPMASSSAALPKTMVLTSSARRKTTSGDGKHSESLRLILDFLRRPWFRHVRVLQELVLSRDPWGTVWETASDVGLTIRFPEHLRA